MGLSGAASRQGGTPVARGAPLNPSYPRPVVLIWAADVERQVSIFEGREIQEMRPRFSFLIGALIALMSCEFNTRKVDAEINDRIDEIFLQVPGLWSRVETEFFERCKSVGVLKNSQDRLDSFYGLIEFVQDVGYPKEFYLNNDSASLALVDDLASIGFVPADESAHRFLHKICSPAVKKYSYGSKDIIYGCGKFDPDSTRIPFGLAAATIPKGFGRPNLNRPGTYKVYLLFFFSEMINEKQRARAEERQKIFDQLP